MKVQFALSAIWDLREIGEYVKGRNPRAALKIEAAIRATADSLQTMALRGRKQRKRNVRRIGVGKYPFNIFYHVDASQGLVTILNIRHTARKELHRNA